MLIGLRPAEVGRVIELELVYADESRKRSLSLWMKGLLPYRPKRLFSGFTTTRTQ